ncbi:hypothetical protein LMG19145_04024 [Xanthomonas arboricola pv. fragariae]|nr:AAA family ATPase [Xanthomonas arboricola]SOU12889.1 hypothetical protein LMG19145_04024 [Xanthomonas arboricola pv. fragariae]
MAGGGCMGGQGALANAFKYECRSRCWKTQPDPVTSSVIKAMLGRLEQLADYKMSEGTMANNEDTAVGLGSAPSIVEFFSIEGLYGYRTVSMSSSYAATVLIAKNGSGKTTLIGALDAFLRCQFGRLSSLHFEKIVCKLRGVKEALELTSVDVEALMSVPEIPEFIMAARRYGVEPTQLLDFIENEFDPSKKSIDEEDEVYKKIMARLNYNYSEVKRACERIADTIKGRVPRIEAIRVSLRSALNGVDIVYLPTYRRIELSLGESSEDGRFKRRPSIQSRLGLPKRGLFNTDIQFGLSDISERLRELNNLLLANSNQGYREISAKIINDLLDGTFERVAPELSDRPDKESLQLFFSRLKQGGRYMYGPFFERVEIPDLDKVYNEGASSDTSNKFLNYFLSKLNTVIQATRSIEGLVEDFVDHCNAYLSARDATTELQEWNGVSRPSVTRDDKMLKIDRMSLQVSVVSVATRREVPMDSLSSGEKQMISLFARLYLYRGSKIVLIDEPELSLSIDWQRKILIDVVGAPTCSQVIAITHSPFVFDNALEPYARALKLSIDRSQDDDQRDDDLFSGDDVNG